MKKLMVLAAVVVASVMANAATLKWGSGTITLADSTTAGKGAVSAYLFVIDSTAYASLASKTGAALSDAVYSAYGSSTASASATGSSSAKGAVTLTDPTAYANGNTAYAAILYVEGDNYMGNVGTYTFDSDLNYTMSDMASKVGGLTTGASTAWSTAAVPEPTSGLLMLLGMAGLAIRRRRA